jgi:hypothetical protein
MISALAADLLVENQQLRWNDLELARTMEWQDFHGPGEPITGVGGVIVSSFQEALFGLTSINENMKADLKKRDHKIRRRKKHTVAALENIAVQTQVNKLNFAKAKARSEVEEQEASYNLHGEADPPGSKLSQVNTTDTNTRPPALSTVTTEASLTAPPSKPAVVSKDVAKGIGHSAKVVLDMPMEMYMALTLGFRNAPRLYGDNTVRPQVDSITGFRSGLKAAGDEFFLGFYDGITGLVRIPVADVKAGGMMALPKGLAKSLGGLVLKPISGILGLGAYTGKGFQAGIRKRIRDTTHTERWTRRARMMQGAQDIRELEAQKATSGAAGNRTDNRLAKSRAQVIQNWGSEERDMVEKARRKDQRMRLVPTKCKAGHGGERPAVVKA